LSAAASIEETVRCHPDEQLAYLAASEETLCAIISAIRVEELAHLDRAISSSGTHEAPDRVLSGFISLVTECLNLALDLR
jgi:demethoxyubiquinone hydroxylase (CLK1/Coq7/Cat5 family)